MRPFPPFPSSASVIESYYLILYRIYSPPYLFACIKHIRYHIFTYYAFIFKRWRSVTNQSMNCWLTLERRTYLFWYIWKFKLMGSAPPLAYEADFLWLFRILGGPQLHQVLASSELFFFLKMQIYLKRRMYLFWYMLVFGQLGVSKKDHVRKKRNNSPVRRFLEHLNVIREERGGG